MKILVVGPGKHPYTQKIRGDLASMQAVVGGLIQAAYPFEEDIALICNEDLYFCDILKAIPSTLSTYLEGQMWRAHIPSLKKVDMVDSVGGAYEQRQ